MLLDSAFILGHIGHDTFVGARVRLDTVTTTTVVKFGGPGTTDKVPERL